jgi:hypothetical protein
MPVHFNCLTGGLEAGVSDNCRVQKNLCRFLTEDPFRDLNFILLKQAFVCAGQRPFERSAISTKQK